MALVERAMPLGGGGISLNFEVVGGTTEPTNPKENTIWVNTATAIGEWQFSATEPTTRADDSALVAGDVLIKTGVSSSAKFNALKKNGISIYPMTTAQWDGSKWARKDAYIYSNAEWKRFENIIAGRGSDITSWTFIQAVNKGTTGSVTEQANGDLKCVVAVTSQQWDNIFWATTAPTNKGDANTIQVTLRLNSFSGDLTANLFEIVKTQTGTSGGVSVDLNSFFVSANIGKLYTFTADISSIDFDFYINFFGSWQAAAKADFDIVEIQMY